jgi:hypothetical protein
MRDTELQQIGIVAWDGHPKHRNLLLRDQPGDELIASAWTLRRVVPSPMEPHRIGYVSKHRRALA